MKRVFTTFTVTFAGLALLAGSAFAQDGTDTPSRADNPDRPNRPSTDRPQSDRPQSDRPRSDRPQSDRPQSDRPSDRPDRDRRDSDRPDRDRPDTDRPDRDGERDIDPARLALRVLHHLFEGRGQKYDADGDGKVSPEEFRQVVADHPRVGQLEFDRLDVDDDGYLTKADLRRMKARLGHDGEGGGDQPDEPRN